MAPFWADVDLRLAGSIQYEVHSSNSGPAGSVQLLQNVSDFVSRKVDVDFNGTWMIVVSWEQVHPWPHGSPALGIFYPDSPSVSLTVIKVSRKVSLIVFLCT